MRLPCLICCAPPSLITDVRINLTPPTQWWIVISSWRWQRSHLKSRGDVQYLQQANGFSTWLANDSTVDGKTTPRIDDHEAKRWDGCSGPKQTCSWNGRNEERGTVLILSSHVPVTVETRNGERDTVQCFCKFFRNQIVFGSCDGTEVPGMYPPSCSCGAKFQF